MKSLVTAFFASLLLATSPAWADRGNGHGKHWNKHAQKQWKKEQKHWAKRQEHARKHARHFRDERVVANYYYPAPRVTHHYTYVAPAPYPPPGVHVVLPNIYVPF